MFNDYPISAVNNALKGIELNKKNGNKCSTSVGKKKANEELDLTQVAEAFGGYIIEANGKKKKPDPIFHGLDHEKT